MGEGHAPGRGDSQPIVEIVMNVNTVEPKVSNQRSHQAGEYPRRVLETER